ncbi:Endochitinase A [Heracleum sosnowskyi]|uniref:Endochitinase A n=1 Tax=Heracleum sosnowskyi TaxID=360622 RepID=A0AAD8MLU6_9APIA|nr:Endochitinase A [Heracleum sosnowskyi]
MKGASKVMMVAALVMVASLAIVLGLVLVLVAELYCSGLFGRRKGLRTTTSTGTADSTAENSSQQSHNQSFIASLSSFHAQGVLKAPRSLLFPAVSSKNKVDIENQLSQAPTQASESQTQKHFPTSHQFEILCAEPLPLSSSFQPVLKVPTHNGGASTSKNGACGHCEENLVYISNPVYDNAVNQTSLADTPFGTPDSSPSRLEISGSSSEDDDGGTTFPITPPLTPMKKLPVEACSVPLRDARSLGTTASYSNSNDGDLSSSSSGSPSTSHPW